MERLTEETKKWAGKALRGMRVWDLLHNFRIQTDALNANSL